jgi:hypothetical protein
VRCHLYRIHRDLIKILQSQSDNQIDDLSLITKPDRDQFPSSRSWACVSGSGQCFLSPFWKFVMSRPNQDSCQSTLGLFGWGTKSRSSRRGQPSVLNGKLGDQQLQAFTQIISSIILWLFMISQWWHGIFEKLHSVLSSNTPWTWTEPLWTWTYGSVQSSALWLNRT